MKLIWIIYLDFFRPRVEPIRLKNIFLNLFVIHCYDKDTRAASPVAPKHRGGEGPVSPASEGDPSAVPSRLVMKCRAIGPLGGWRRGNVTGRLKSRLRRLGHRQLRGQMAEKYRLFTVYYG
jgi:hypothetical protein